MSFFTEAVNSDVVDSFFAAANTQNGFVSYFDSIFQSAPMIYVIKGGPGTGKSTLMNKIASEAVGRGYTVTKYLCSSDPSSLDGVLVKGKFAVIDGTAPHSSDPRCIGALDKMIDLSPMWDDRILLERKESICRLSGEIADRYAHAYRILSSMGSLEQEYYQTVFEHLNMPKLQRLVARIAKKAANQQTTSEGTRSVITEAISTKGYVHLSSVENSVTKAFCMKGRYHEEVWFLKLLKEALDKAGACYTQSLSPLTLEPCSIAIGNQRAFVSVDRIDNQSRMYNTSRFLLPTVALQRSRLSTMSKALKLMSGTATSLLAEAGTLHLELEEIYKSAMNYEKLERFTKRLMISLFC